jgi:hypothetical protein
MKKLSYAARRIDDNQGVIVEALRRAGATVILLHAVGKGVPDLLVGYHGVTALVEVKNPVLKGKLNTLQLAWCAEWRGSLVHVVHTPDEAVAVLELIRQHLQ